MADQQSARKSESKKSSGGEKISRIEALDVFRALMMFLMIFVNDIPGLKDIPSWLLHAATDEDRLGFSDVVFPGFLFAMGMAIPYALETRRQKGDPLWSVGLHIVLRSAALLVMGVFIVNYDTIGKCLVSQPWFGIGMVVSFFLIWNEYSNSKSWWVHLLRIAGLGVLVFLAYQYKGKEVSHFDPQWWGILGLIGWSYLVCAVLVLFTRFNLLLILMVSAAAIALCVLPNSGVSKQLHLYEFRYLFPAGGVLTTFAIIGAMTGVLAKHFGEKANFGKTLLPLLSGLTLAALAAAYWARHHWIISKNQATPTWLFLCCGIFFALFLLLYWLVDVGEKGKWFKVIAPAGAASLTCYMIPYLWYSVQSLTGWWYPKILNAGWQGLARSVVFSLCCIGIVWFLMKIKIRLKI